MSRSGYIDACDSEQLAKVNLWRGAVRRAALGKRGRKAIQDLADALDAMPDKKLADGFFKTKEGAHCALGALLEHRGTELPEDLRENDDYERLEYCSERIAHVLNIAPALAAEVMYLNDECDHKSDYMRWQYIRNWCAAALKGNVW